MADAAQRAKNAIDAGSRRDNAVRLHSRLKYLTAGEFRQQHHEVSKASDPSGRIGSKVHERVGGVR
jgi:transposase InsO family protein